MSASFMPERITGASPRLKARIAGVFYWLAALAARIRRGLLRGRWAVAAGLVAVSCFVAVTLVLYDIFKPVNGRLSLFATSVNLAGITLEAFRLNPQGVDIARVCHGFYCLLIGYLIFRSTFLPPILGALMAFAGLAWMTFLFPPLASYLSPYNVASGFLGEGSPMQGLLVMGVHVERWQERASCGGAPHIKRFVYSRYAAAAPISASSPLHTPYDSPKT
jgi:hypothetical protein